MGNNDHELMDGHIHEALDRLHVAQLYLDKLVAGHPLIDAVPEFHAQVQGAIERLGALYQEVGGYGSIEEVTQQHALKAGYRVMTAHK